MNSRSDRRRSKRLEEKLQHLMDMNLEPGKVYVTEVAYDDWCPCATGTKPMTACICNPDYYVTEVKHQ